jgi:Glycosyl hydrolases family 31 TIM-barrel domain/Glycosyl hydrolase family 31 C-terminal domain/Domain of unknown function (DUF5110)
MRTNLRTNLVLVSAAALLGLACGFADPASAARLGSRPATVRDGPARIQVLSPTLFRLEYAADGGFENRPTLTVSARPSPRARFRSRLVDGRRVITTKRAVLTYQVGAGPFAPTNLSLRLRGRGSTDTVHPAFGGADVPPTGSQPPGLPPPNPDPDPHPRTAGNLGGWYRGLDGQAGPVALHDGLLSRDGWFLLDDTVSPVLTEGGRWYEPRPQHLGPYQDGYLFAYGRDYATALSDFRSLAGAAPLLPRKAFGVWFSRYSFYSARDYRELLDRFRSQRVPLDVLAVDTDFKWPNPWNGWQWTSVGFADPAGFLDWAHSKGLDVVLNVHPSITDADPGFAAANAEAGGLLPDSGHCNPLARTTSCRVWDWARREHVRSYFSLHQPFERQGVDFWWLDWNGDESRAEAPGLTPDAWINSLYAERQRERGSRWLPLSRIGSSAWHYGAPMPGVWAEHRDAIHFTGDTASTWEMLDFQSRFTAAEGAGIGMPYVSHDIGGYVGDRLSRDMYVRWVQLGAFQPILRLHSDHGRRLPWEYPGRAGRIASRFLRLRESLVPYTYTAARESHDSGLPIARAMYLGWPGAGAAYRFDRQYMFGDSLLVAPVGSPGARARKRVWFPSGEWVDIFNGKRHRGPRAETLTVPLERMPVFARAGAIVPREPYAGSVDDSRPDRMLLDVYAGADGRFSLYEDAGRGNGYRDRRFSRTKLGWREGGGRATLRIGAAHGSYQGEPAKRSYVITITGIARPRQLVLNDGGKPGRVHSWRYRAGTKRLIIRTGRLPSRRPASLRIAFRDRR